MEKVFPVVAVTYMPSLEVYKSLKGWRFPAMFDSGFWKMSIFFVVGLMRTSWFLTPFAA